MEEQRGKLKRTKDPLLDEAKLLCVSLTKKIFKEYKRKENVPFTLEEAADNINDLQTIHDCLYRILQRRGDSHVLHG